MNENAVSQVGAIGIMQIMPETFREINNKNPHYAEVDKPRWNIAAGIYYNRFLYRKFPKTPEQDRLYLALASYNAGYGRTLNASRKLKKDGPLWVEVKPYLPRETRAYVSRIQKLMGTSG